jgi:thiamine biosynthesis lipoprotein
MSMGRTPAAPIPHRGRRVLGPAFLPALAAFALLAACAGPPPVVSKQDFIMDTSIALTLNSERGEEVAKAIFARLHAIDALVRVQNRQSEAWAINQAAGKQPVTVSSDTLAIAGIALDLARLSRGAFDPTIGGVTLLWNIEGEQPHIPSAAELAVLLPLVNWQWVRLDAGKSQVFLERPGMQLDFGGVGKGYAALEAARMCREAGVKSALLNMGDSSIYALGTKPNGSKWRIGIQNPDVAAGSEVERGKMLGVVEVADGVVESSGVYERFFERGGTRYHHIMDPKTGFPADNGLVQVTLILPGDTRFADGLSTAVFVLGPVAGRQLIEDMPGAAAILVGAGHQVVLTSRAKGLFKLSDESFHVVERLDPAAASVRPPPEAASAASQ